jgi:hypothetical protein
VIERGRILWLSDSSLEQWHPVTRIVALIETELYQRVHSEEHSNMSGSLLRLNTVLAIKHQDRSG